MENYPYRSDRWWVSPFNFAEDVRNQFRLPKKVKIYDTTLRDGEETPGVYLRKEAKIKIARELNEIGIERIESGMPGTTTKDKELTKELVKLGLEAKIFALCHAKKEEIDDAIDCDVSHVMFIIPIGEPKNVFQYKFTVEEIIENSLTLIEYCKAHGLFTVVSPYDTTRSDLNVLRRYLRQVILPTKADGVVLSDTVGCSLPSAISYLVKQVKKIIDVPVEIHVHNDFGLATACSLAAVGAGAEVVDATVNGLGEGTGVASLEEIIVGLKLLYGFNLRYKVEKLYQVSKLVEELSGIKNSVIKPVVGEYIFGREFASALKRADAFKSLLQNPLAIRSMAPSLLGRKATVYLGRKSGAQSVRGKLKELGLEASEPQVEEILVKVKNELAKGKRLVPDEEFVAIWKGVVTGM